MGIRRKMTQKWAMRKEQSLEEEEWVGMENCASLPPDVLWGIGVGKGWEATSWKTRTVLSTGLAGEVIFALL